MIDHGHSVLAIPVPELNGFVRSRTAHYDADYLSADAEFGQAHITVLGPWVRSPTPDDLDAVGRIVGTADPFTYQLAQTGVFPNGIIHLLPDPSGPFVDLSARVCAQFPDHPPYAGQFPDPIPHLTLDAVGPDVDEAGVQESLADQVPITAQAERLQLQWWQAGNCHTRHTWWLGRS